MIECVSSLGEGRTPSGLCARLYHAFLVTFQSRCMQIITNINDYKFRKFIVCCVCDWEDRRKLRELLSVCGTETAKECVPPFRALSNSGECIRPCAHYIDSLASLRTFAIQLSLHSLQEQEAFEKCWAHSPLRATARRLF